MAKAFGSLTCLVFCGDLSDKLKKIKGDINFSTLFVINRL